MKSATPHDDAGGEGESRARHVLASSRLRRPMSLVVVGSIAFDAVRTPFGERERMLGGSAVHFSLAASFFTDVRVVGPVGDDFSEAEYEVLRRPRVSTRTTSSTCPAARRSSGAATTTTTSTSRTPTTRS